MRQLTGNAVREAPVAAPRPITGRSHWRGLIVATLAGLLMAFVGAFGTGGLPLLPRVGYWLILMESGALIGIGASTCIRGWHRLSHRPLAEGALISLMIALPLTLVATGTTAMFFGPRTFGLSGAITMFVAVFVVTAAITSINYLVGRSSPTVPAPVAGEVPAVAPEPVTAEAPAPAARSSAAPVPPRPRLADRLPPHLRATDLIALEAEDHYVRVHTAAGSDLLLLRFTDAIAELDELHGARTHRSWWVARSAVRSATRADSRGELTLDNGIVAPVSRSALAVLQRDGWFTAP